MKKIVRRINIITCLLGLVAAIGCFDQITMLPSVFHSNTVYAATTLTSDDGLWTFTADGKIQNYLGTDTQVTIPAQLTSNSVTYDITEIPWTALSWNTSITQVNIGSNISKIDNSCFIKMTSLVSIEVSDDNPNYCDIDGILYNKAQTKLLRLPQMNTCNTLNLPDGFTESSINGIETCPNIHIIKIPASYTGKSSYTGDPLEKISFPNLEAVEVLPGNTFFSSENGVLYNLDKTVLLWYPQKKAATDFTIPNSVTTIGTYSFTNVSLLQNLNLTANIETIDASAFRGCQITSINNITTRADYVNWTPAIKSVFQDNIYAFEDVPVAISLVEQEVQYAVDTYIEDGMNDYQKIKALYTYVVNKVAYTSGETSDMKNHCISSIFLGDTTVCEGYALGMSLLLDKVGITNCPVSGSNHAWVVVQLNGIWLEIDPTWDDCGSYAGTTYFLKTAQEYSSIHPAYVDLCNNSFTKYSFGVNKSMYAVNLPICDTIIGDLNHDGELTQYDLNCMADEVRGYAMYSIEGYYNVLADMNRDGAINTDDYNLLYDLVY
ncbi:leucine-rich repeat protein [Anaeromicropila populeti]|uniref:Leucine rich repeat-containing protein n=1 Tax=Anaeromicropila populeti TaxID=37658 RepID=A0A1I6IDT0_9FIRM|nr:leucine-rich repeat protein [Anaeromicropila populeti]SFR64843.1 Leucine rich repeat-containing protein [Anaeromicropila populeti]